MKKIIFSIFWFLLLVFPGCHSLDDNDSLYGDKIPIIGNLNIGPCLDAAVDGNTLYVIGSRSIFSFDISSPKKPVLLHRLEGLGFVRQIEVQDGYAYVTSRAYGLFVIDISNRNELVLVVHYDSLELATGISVSGSLMAVSNRQFGVELVDISNPRKPRFMAKVRTGEAQSVFIKDKLLFAGVWETSKVVICDISDPYAPQIISEAPMDGYGDGVFVRGDYCFAATGHHANSDGQIKASMRGNPLSHPAWGRGHGMEIIDVKDPENPKTLSVLKLPDFHLPWPDLWDVQVSGDYAYVSDSEAGLFIVDISDPSNPYFVEHLSLPKTESGKNEPVAGFAIGDGVVYLTGMRTEVYITEPGVAKAKPIVVEKADLKPWWETDTVIDRSTSSVYDPGQQVHAAYVCEKQDKAILAAGYGGVHEVKLFPELSGKQILETKSIVFDVYLQGDKLYLAEGIGGLSVWEYKNDTQPKLLGRYIPGEEGVFQLVIDPEEKYAVLHTGHSTLDIVDVSDPHHMVRIEKFRKRPIFYRLPLARGLLKGRYAACFWSREGGFLYDIRGKEGENLLGPVLPPMLWMNGLAFFEDRIMAINEGGYLLGDLPGENGKMKYDSVSIENVWLEGKPVIYGSRLYISNRMEGEVTAIDISDVYAPRKSWQLHLSGNPGQVTQHEDMVIVPAGHDGLMIFNAENGEPYYGSN